jgi:hypothetical protein
MCFITRMLVVMIKTVSCLTTYSHNNGTSVRRLLNFNGFSDSTQHYMKLFVLSAIYHEHIVMSDTCKYTV